MPFVDILARVGPFHGGIEPGDAWLESASDGCFVFEFFDEGGFHSRTTR
uniref:Uncharacterized protein n=1 Tax=Candidatus Kentrum sp. FM TaxID=2126340 RepID=A0A450TTB2_9GAMM|nr:MAG: hypothetical protein BECKFM1743C_GA0114222_106191 [Candidatus Kentron sp. FM]